MIILPIALELTGIVIVSTGIGIELATGANIGLILITIGSCMVAVGGMIYAKILPLRKRK